MMAELSVKGMTVGTKEFVEVAKAGERQFEAEASLDKFEEEAEALTDHLPNFSGGQWAYLHAIVSEFIPEWGGNGK